MDKTYKYVHYIYLAISIRLVLRVILLLRCDFRKYVLFVTRSEGQGRNGAEIRRGILHSNTCCKWVSTSINMDQYWKRAIHIVILSGHVS